MEAVHRIISTMTLCGEKIGESNMFEKNLTTFQQHIVLRKQYRRQGFSNSFWHDQYFVNVGIE